LCCCPGSVEWCALKGLRIRRAQLPNCPTHAVTLALAPQEANYAHQQELDMIPLMMQKDYSPKGWLGLILGTRLWYAMWGMQIRTMTLLLSSIGWLVWFVRSLIAAS
jgi:hypothetical protein